MKIYGIFGDPIEHSLSPAMHNAAFEAMNLQACYHAFLVRKRKLRDAILGASAMGFGGLNLTIPLKEKALEIICPDDLADAIGAVNTVLFSPEEEALGYNTDGAGALLALQSLGAKVKGARILLIGAGGAAKAIAYALALEEAELTIANRDRARAEELAERSGARACGLDRLDMLVPQAEVVINASSVGMREGDARLFHGSLLHRGQLVFDIVYNRETELLKDASSAGAETLDGVMMLVYQGAKAIEIWTGREAPVDLMEKAVRSALEMRRGK